MPEILTVKEVCDILKVSKSTLYRVIRSNELQSVKVRSAIRIKKDDLVRYIDSYGQAV